MKKTIPLILVTIFVLFGCASMLPEEVDALYHDVVSVMETHDGIYANSLEYRNVCIRWCEVGKSTNKNYEYSNYAQTPFGYVYSGYTVDRVYENSSVIYVTLYCENIADYKRRNTPTSMPPELENKIIDGLQSVVRPPETERTKNELYKGKVFTQDGDTLYCIDAVGKSYHYDTYVDTANRVMYSKVSDMFGMTSLHVILVARGDYSVNNTLAGILQDSVGTPVTYTAKAVEEDDSVSVRLTPIDAWTDHYANGTYVHNILYSFSSRWKDKTIILWDTSDNMVYNGIVNK